MLTRHKDLFFADKENPGLQDEQIVSRYPEIPKGGLGDLPDEEMALLLEYQTKKKLPDLKKNGVNTDGLTVEFYFHLSETSKDYAFGGNPRRGMNFLGEYLRDCRRRADAGEKVQAGMADYETYLLRRPSMSLEAIQTDIKQLI